MALSLPTRIIRHRLEAGGLAQRVEVIFAAGLRPFQSLTVAGLLSRRLTPDALPLVGWSTPISTAGNKLDQI